MIRQTAGLLAVLLASVASVVVAEEASTLSPQPSAEPAAVQKKPLPEPACSPTYRNKLVVTGIALALPAQIEPKENSALVHDTAIELARKLKSGRWLLAEAAESTFPYTSAQNAPDSPIPTGKDEDVFVSVAKARRAQFVLSGVYRDLGINHGWIRPLNERAIVLEMYLHDGADGVVLARERFATTAKGNVTIGNTPAIGSERFYASDFGKVWGGLLDEIVAWTNTSAACQPLAARISKIEGGNIFINAGTEAGVKVSSLFRLTPPPASASDLVLGVKSVHAGYAIAETRFNTKMTRKIQPGDLLYLQ